MNKQQNLKYTIVNNKLVNRETGEELDDDMPVFILLAKDKNAITTLEYYKNKTTNIEYKKNITGCIDDFIEFKDLYPERMKEPD
jgi:hypothetical protein